MGIWSDKLIGERATAAEQARAPILPYIRECLRYTMPWRLEGRQGGAGFDAMYDSTGPINVQRSAARLQRDLTPPFQRWFELEAGPVVPEHLTEKVNRALVAPTTIAHAILDASAFSTASIEAYSDLLVSTGALLAMEGDDRNPIRWTSVPAWALAIEAGPDGRIDNNFWRKKFPAWILPTHWPQAKWPAEISKKIADRSTDPVGVLQASYYDPDFGGWRVCVQCDEGGKGHTVYDSARDRTNPWIVFRYWTTPGDPWGRGPAMLALPDIRTANKTVEMILKAAAYSLAPPLMVLHDGVVNPDTLRLAPQALIKVARTGGPMGRSIEPLNLGSNMNTGQLILEDLRQNITSNLMGKQLPPSTGAVRSASEIIERTKELQYDTGAAFGRLNHEYIPQVVARVLDVLDRKKVVGINWDELQLDQLIMRVKVTSPLARGQNLEDVQTIVQFWELAKTLGGEEAFIHIANTEDGLPKLAKLMGVPMWAVNDQEARDALARAAGQMAANVMAGGDLAAVAAACRRWPALCPWRREAAMGPNAEHALGWLRDGAIAPDPRADPRGQAGSDDMDRRARAMKSAFAGEQGQLALDTILQASLFRAPVDCRLAGAEYRQHAQTREGQNQLAALILTYLDHADALERKTHERSRSGRPGGPGPDPGGALISGDLAVALARTVEPAGEPGSVSDEDWLERSSGGPGLALS